MGVAQHHDAVSGTAKQHVSNDYSRRVQAGINKASNYVTDKLKRLLANDSAALEALSNLVYCQLVNETICDISQVSHVALAKESLRYTQFRVSVWFLSTQRCEMGWICML